MLGNVDQLGQSVWVNRVENRRPLVRTLASGAVGNSCRRRHLTGTLPNGPCRREGKKERQKKNRQGCFVFDQSKLLPMFASTATNALHQKPAPENN
jgi:hypothetical protein